MRNPSNPPQQIAKRDVLWHVKWLFACYAAALGLSFFAALISIPFVGYVFLEWLFEPAGSIALLATAVLISPLIYRHLK